MMEARETFHAFIAKRVEEIVEDTIAGGKDCVIRSKDCRYGIGEELHELSLYYAIPGINARSPRDYQYCRPDLLVCPKNTITGIIEIEENSDQKTPVTLFGKFSAACATRYYIPSSTKRKEMHAKSKELDESVVFIHVAKSRSKDEKLDRIGRDIRDNMIPKLGGRIRRYELFYGKRLDFDRDGRLWESFCKAIESMLNR